MNIILASASPRRKEILENTNVKFKIMASSIEELTLEGESPCQMVMRLAFEKGIDIASRQKSDLVISADTIVVLDNTVLGKPKDEIEARKMITSLSGRTHQVITGISLINLDNNKKIIDYVISNVKFKNLSEEDINDYIRTKESLDKAGAYGIQGYGALLVEEIQGDYFNIVGLPISRLSDLLKKYFNINLFMEGDVSEEKMLAQGEKSLSNAELLAIILRTGTKQKNVIDLANYIINKDSQGIRYLQDITIDELCEIDGVGLTKATMIKAALELGRRVASFKPNKYKVKNPWDIYKYYMDSLRYLKKEVFKVVLLNTKNEIITDVDVSVGTLNSSLVHPREVFIEAIKRSSNKIILIHNHPSGSIEPSVEDKNITKRLISCGEIIGIEVIDHIIIGDGMYFSFKENMII